MLIRQKETRRNSDNNDNDFFPLEDSLTDRFWSNSTDTPMAEQTIPTLINHQLSSKQAKANKHQRNLAAASSS